MPEDKGGMKFASARQRRYMFAVVPDAAKKWAHGRKTRPSDWRKRKPSRTYVSAVVAAGYKDHQRRDNDGKWTDTGGGGVDLLDRAPSLTSEDLTSALKGMWSYAQIRTPEIMGPKERVAVVEQLEELHERYPQVRFSKIRLERDPGSSKAGQYTPSLAHLRVNLADLQRRSEKSIQENWLVPSSNGGIKATLRHEFGHAVHDTIGMNDPEFIEAINSAVSKVAGKPFRIIPSKKEPYPIVWTTSDLDFDFRKWISGQLSDYAATQPVELIGEAWSEYTDKGGKPRPLAQAIGEVMEEFLTRYAGPQ